jgi:hypothetical protein
LIVRNFQAVVGVDDDDDDDDNDGDDVTQGSMDLVLIVSLWL